MSRKLSRLPGWSTSTIAVAVTGLTLLGAAAFAARTVPDEASAGRDRAELRSIDRELNSHESDDSTLRKVGSKRIGEARLLAVSAGKSVGGDEVIVVSEYYVDDRYPDEWLWRASITAPYVADVGAAEVFVDAKDTVHVVYAELEPRSRVEYRSTDGTWQMLPTVGAWGFVEPPADFAGDLRVQGARR